MSNLFDSLKGREIKLPNKPELRRFEAHEYHNGRPALAVLVRTEDGDENESEGYWEPDLTVTVNLPELPIPEGSFFVRSHGYEEYLANLLATGLFEDMGVWIPAGYVEKYARIWRLKPVTPTVTIN